jgi:hypothetical protein
MDLTLSDDEASLLRELLDHTYRDIKYEIADTDTRAYKEQLRKREQQLLAMLTRFGGPLPDAPSAS